jgi:transcriptional regulator with XRE-family HTH domain
MQVTKRPLSPFGHRLEPHLKAQKLGLRSLARRMSVLSGQPLEQHRRSLVRWVYGDHVPSAASIELVAAALRIATEELEPDEDEEDSVLLSLRGRVWAIAQRQVVA